MDSTLFEDRFDGTERFGRWALLQAGDFCADDGAIETSAAGLRVAPPERNPETAQPAFAKIETGFNGHLKWLALSKQVFVTEPGPLRVTFTASAQTFGVANHPFGDEVADPLTDLRLAAATLNVLDFESGLVFDFWVTQHAVYPLYERLRPPGSPERREAFVSIATGIRRAAEDEHEFSLLIDAGAGSVRWELDGDVVASVENLGSLAPGWTPVLYHGGRPEAATPRQVQVGMGLMTLLDAALGQPDRGLVDLGTGYLPERTFCGGPHLWGQGAELQVRHILVERA